MPSYRLQSSAGCLIALRPDTEPATPESDVGDRTEDAEIRSQERAATPSTTSGKDIQEVMAKATKAAAHIRLLLHAKVSVGTTKEWRALLQYSVESVWPGSTVYGECYI